MADIFTDLLSKTLQDLPQGANPWDAIRTALTDRVRPHAPLSFLGQLYMLSAAIAEVTLVLAGCLYVKYRQRVLWFVRMHRGTGGTYLVVHYSNGWTAMFLLFLGVLQGYIWQTVFYNQGKPAEHSDLWRQAWFINTCALLAPVLLAVVVAVLAWEAHRHYHESLVAYGAIEDALAAAARSFDGHFDPSVLRTGMGAVLTSSFTENLSGFGHYFRWVFVTYLIATVLLEGVLCLTALLHLRELRRTMQDLRARAHVSEEARLQKSLIKHGYQSLLYVTCSIIAACTAINALFIFVAAAGPKVVYDSKYSEVASLLPLWLFAVLGLPLSALWLRRLLQMTPPRDGDGTDPSTASPAETARPPSVVVKDLEHASEAYPLDKLSTFAYGGGGGAKVDPYPAMSVDSDAGDSLRTSGAHSFVPLVSQTPPLPHTPGSPQTHYSSYSSRSPAFDVTHHVVLGRK
ncbi:hypothetical protein JCM8202v2_002190 [Rhodotorula sphaerocarpa]